MTMLTKGAIALCCLSALLLCASLWRGQINVLQAENALLLVERDQNLATAKSFEQALALCTRNTALLQGATRECLEREQEGAATAELWQDILDKAQSRDATAKEQQGVPDNATRRKLFTDLDRPL